MQIFLKILKIIGNIVLFTVFGVLFAAVLWLLSSGHIEQQLSEYSTQFVEWAIDRYDL